MVAGEQYYEIVDNDKLLVLLLKSSLPKQSVYQLRVEQIIYNKPLTP